jgi:hypothetical protein
MRLKTGDIIILILSVSFTFILSFVIYSSPVTNKKVYIYAGGKEYIYPLEYNRKIEVPGPLGNTEVEIKDNHVHVISSPCTLKICIKKGAISRAGDWISCLPNNVLIIIKGEKKNSDEIDGISQ